MDILKKKKDLYLKKGEEGHSESLFLRCVDSVGNNENQSQVSSKDTGDA